MMKSALLDDNNNNEWISQPRTHLSKIVELLKIQADVNSLDFEKIGSVSVEICSQFPRYGNEFGPSLADSYKITFHFDGKDESYSVVLKETADWTHRLRDSIDPASVNSVLSDKATNRKVILELNSKSAEILEKEIRLYRAFNDAFALSRKSHGFFNSNCPNARPLRFLPRIITDSTSKLDIETSADLPNNSNSFYLCDDVSKTSIAGDIFNGLSKPQVDTAIAAIAEFHAFSLWMRKSDDLFTCISPRLPDTQKSALLKRRILSKLLCLPSFEEHEASLIEFFDTTNYAEIDSHGNFGISPVLSHGNYCASDIFFARDSTEIYTIMEWQMAYPSTGLNDIARLILTSVNASLRLKHLDEWIALYFSKLCRFLRARKVKHHYTLDLVRRMFRFEYDSQLLYSFGLLQNLMEQAQDEGIATGIFGRMVAGFEFIRMDFTKPKEKEQ
ncbi:ecdysteroid kinase domain-containing protein [Ditylenchus destructor]|nr:ecdysteroid kinase domain-containing protein [Ditylenchus destructor]